MRSKQPRSERPSSARRNQLRMWEPLESRQVLSYGAAHVLQSLYVPTDLYVTNPVTHQRIPFSSRDLMQHNNADSPMVSNQGKIVSGTNRQGDTWTITVHGPGQVIVTDTTPNDGVLNDDIATIQIIGSNLRSTYVTGTTVASNRVISSGTVNFNRLIASQGVRSIELNGFNLSNNVTPAVTESPGVFLLGGVQTLKFHDILALINTSESSTPYQIVIGDSTTPLSVKPSIYLNSIVNSVFDSTSESIPGAPLTTPTVQFSVNGIIQDFSVVSITQSPVSPNYLIATDGLTDNNSTAVPASGQIPAAYQFQYNVVGTTGRTSLQALAINNLNVRGKATNFTAQRDTVPFATGLSGLRYLRNANFGANADAVALDVDGPIGRLNFRRGLGDPTGVFTARKQVASTDETTETRYQYLPATSYGVPLGSEGYPAHGLQGGAISARNIRSVKIGPANYDFQLAQNPNFRQMQRVGSNTYYNVNPGTALTNSSITTDGSIDQVDVTGNQLNSEIKTGFDYQAYLAGLQGTRSASRIARLRQNGDLVNSVDSATFRPTLDPDTNTYVYRFSTDAAGDGSITGRTSQAVGHGRYAATYSRIRTTGGAYNTGGRTALGNYGAGFYARVRNGNLPPVRS